MPFDPSTAVPVGPAPPPGRFDPSTAKPVPMSAGDVMSGAATNFLPSAGRLAKNIVTPILHPIEAAKSLYHLGAGIIEKAIPGEQADEATANAVGKYFSDRYGGLENVKRTIASDPAGFMADASVVLGGGGAALRATGIAGKVADVANSVGHVANPIALGIKGADYGAKGAGYLASEALGVTTGAGGQSIRTAYDAGRQGGGAATAFSGNMRGNVPIENIVTQARGALGQLKNDRRAEYLAGMGGVSADPTVLNLSPVDADIAKADSFNTFHGVDLAKSTTKVRTDINDTLDFWRKQDPATFHTAAGFDALKKSIGDIRDTTQYGTPDRAIADTAYNAVKNAIVKQAPAYADTMKGYSDASENIDDITKTLSLGQKASTDTSVRKLQSALRDNVNTSYGRRTDLAQQLAGNGAPNLMESIGGQTLSSVAPRGLGKVLAGGELGAGIVEAMQGHPAMAAALIPVLAAQSPRLVGEAALAAGITTQKASKLLKALSMSKDKASNAGLALALLGQQENNQPQYANFQRAR